MKIRIENDRFIDENGNQILFNGVNLVCKDKEAGYLFPDTELVFRRFREQGFNLIRLGIFWDGVEPQPGIYDKEYLRKVRETVDLAWKYGLFTLLDMHQDLFSCKWGDGAPAWAALDEGAPHPENCTMWYEAYLQSDAVINAADNFWRNAPASDGIGLIDHYEAMWAMLAETFGSCESIIGFEPMNEPFMGSIARSAFGEAAQKTAAQFADYEPLNPLAMTPEQSAFYMRTVSERLTVFDRDQLMPFYRRIQKAVEHSTDIPLVTGGNIYSSSTVPTGITRLDERGNQIYAPHGYDAVVDSDRYESFSKENVEYLFADKHRSQTELNLPVIVGEWGAFPSRDFTNELIRHMNGILEKYLWSSVYWQWMPGLEKDPNYADLQRAYPMSTSGELHSYHFDPEKKEIRIAYTPRKDGVTVVYCPFLPAEGKYTAEKISDDACLVKITADAEEKISVLIKAEEN